MQKIAKFYPIARIAMEVELLIIKTTTVHLLIAESVMELECKSFGFVNREFTAP